MRIVRIAFAYLQQSSKAAPKCHKNPTQLNEMKSNNRVQKVGRRGRAREREREIAKSGDSSKDIGNKKLTQKQMPSQRRILGQWPMPARC